MRNILFFVLLSIATAVFLTMALTVHAAGLTVPQGGTGQVQFATGAIPFGISPASLRFGTSSSLTWDSANSRFNTSAITTTGKVSIGSTSPDAFLSKLFVENNSGSGSDGITVENTTGNGHAYFYLTDSIYGNNFWELDANSSATANSSLLTVPSSGVLRSGTGATGGLIFDAQAAAPIIFANGGFSFASERARFAVGGNFGIATTSPSQRLSLQGSALISGNLSLANLTATGTATVANLVSTASSTISGNLNVGGVAAFGGNVGIGTSSPTYQLTLQESSAADAAQTSGVELINSGAWTVPGDWTTSDNITFTHTASGGTGVLSQNLPLVSGQLYQVTFTQSGRTGSSVTAAMGGVTLTSSNTSNTTQTFYALISNPATPLTFTPVATTWNGAISNVSVQLVSLPPVFKTYDSTGVDGFAIRGTFGAYQNTIIGDEAGATLNLAGLTTGINDTIIGAQAGTLIAGSSDNTAIGFQAMNGGTTLITGTQNVAVGGKSLFALTSAVRNVAIGYTAGTAITSGGDNTIVGWRAGTKITTGSQNVLLGRDAGTSITTASGIVAIGFQAGNALSTSVGLRNTAVGNTTLTLVTTGIGNTAFGASSLLNLNTTSASTTALGALAGTGSAAFISNRSTYVGAGAGAIVGAGSDDNVFVGNNAGQNVTTGRNNILIGPNALATSSTASNFLNIGNTIFGLLTATSSSGTVIPASTGKVGIGTTTPVNALTIAGGIGFYGTIPTLSSCGSSPAIATGSTDNAGEVTEGSVASACTISFSTTLTNAPFCTVTSESGLAFSYAVSSTNIVVTNIGALSSTKVAYRCVQNNN